MQRTIGTPFRLASISLATKQRHPMHLLVVQNTGSAVKLIKLWTITGLWDLCLILWKEASWLDKHWPPHSFWPPLRASCPGWPAGPALVQSLSQWTGSVSAVRNLNLRSSEWSSMTKHQLLNVAGFKMDHFHYHTNCSQRSFHLLKTESKIFWKCWCLCSLLN